MLTVGQLFPSAVMQSEDQGSMSVSPILSHPSFEKKLYVYMWEKEEKVGRRWIPQAEQRVGEVILALLALLRPLWLGQCCPRW